MGFGLSGNLVGSFGKLVASFVNCVGLLFGNLVGSAGKNLVGSFGNMAGSFGNLTGSFGKRGRYRVGIGWDRLEAGGVGIVFVRACECVLNNSRFLSISCHDDCGKSHIVNLATLTF